MSEAAALTLPAGELQVWALQLAGIEAAAAGRWLDAAELARARQFAGEEPRHEFIVTRATLRLLLGGYLACPPSRVSIAPAPRGKPQLTDPSVPLHFNVSHSGGLALFAFSAERTVGVDIEATGDLPDLAEVAERVFDKDDAAAWRALPAEQRLAAFYRAWTHKEACTKASGDGMWADVAAIHVLLDAGSPTTAAGPSAGQRWTLQHVSLGHHDATHAACVAVAGTDAPPIRLRWLDAAAWEAAAKRWAD